MRQRRERFCTVPNIATEHSESLRIGFGFLDLAGLAYAENEKLGSLAARFCCDILSLSGRSPSSLWH
jgi:hypothetical protein